MEMDTVSKEGNVKIIDSLDALALALVNHNHQWTSNERYFYEEAIRILT